MAIKSITEKKKFGRTEIGFVYSYDEEKPEEKTLVAKINSSKKYIEYYPVKAEKLFFNTIYLHGFSSLPELFNNKGYAKNGLLYYIDTCFENKKIKSIKVNRTGNCKAVKNKKDTYLHLSYSLLEEISNEVGSMNYYNNAQKSSFVRKTLKREFPTYVKETKIKTPKYKVKNALRVLNNQDVNTFEKIDIDAVTEILKKLLSSKYTDQIKKSELFTTTKLKIDVATLDEIVKEFSENLKNKISESKWGKFLSKNLFLIDSKYIKAIPELNLVLGGSRKVDFGLVDTQGFLDIYEIKLPSTRLLESQPDHGNYIWNKEAIKAIVQVEKYLSHANRKAGDLKDDIKREKSISLDVVSPRAYIIMGTTQQLDTDEKRTDFRMLKNQFKNIEIILYDELLERLKNQMKRAE